MSMKASPAILTPFNSIARETTKKRFLRAEHVGNTGDNTTQDTNRGDDFNEDAEIGNANTSESEERGDTAAIQKLQSLKTFEKFKHSKTFKALSRSMSKATNTFSEKISSALPMKSKLKVWSNNGKSVSFVRKELEMDKLDDALLTQAKNFQFYDDYVTLQLPVWAKNELTPKEVIAELGLQGLSGAALTSNPNFKYYDEYLVKQALVWAKKDLDVDDILVSLDLNIIPVAVRSKAVNFKYYEEFVAGLMRSWTDNDVSVIDVMKKLKLNKLTGETLEKHPNYKYYKNYVKNNLKAWAADLKSYEFVVAKLGLRGKRGELLQTHQNVVFLEKLKKSADRYREKIWLQQSVTSYEAWKRLELERVHAITRPNSPTYAMYEHYVNLVDDAMVKLIESGEKNLPKLIDTNASPKELSVKAYIWAEKQRPEWYVKFSLGLEKLDETALKDAANYVYYMRYLDAKN
ncbi:hypothetical protein F444_10975 [Phytophthora nicotianae P1976]|uniref:RxLR effector protein n=1 Tax=Phytophthora nicotianae P1976 TaxID=1317066 RepID=A0A081A2F7_PHYNI|nr:hypothetical protein F444_10975 [Phytophthora nicotianae P1976]